ncbi:hypothetical protein H0266_18290 [Halobacillus locisalis]|uniref:TadE-like protein n=1 Tax=Halobacillus locisalis TaxID=220753 RepID=A0A838CXF9_9BACI|nr:hypothetical protein [Halobacillus locisalis]MBA2176832.1 hypothetical protein [Halobacillus locisalis]
MNEQISILLLLPFILWSSLQGILYSNYTMVDEALKIGIYEGQKEASLQGRYDVEIYDDIKGYLVDVHNFDPSKIEVKGTEKITPRGEHMSIQVTIPRPVTSVLGIFTPRNDSPMIVKKEVMSEYLP